MNGTTTYASAPITLAEIIGYESEIRMNKPEHGLDNDLDVSPVTLSSAWSRVARLLLLSSMAVGGSVGNIFMISAVVVEDQLRKRANRPVAEPHLEERAGPGPRTRGRPPRTDPPLGTQNPTGQRGDDHGGRGSSAEGWKGMGVEAFCYEDVSLILALCKMEMTGELLKYEWNAFLVNVALADLLVTGLVIPVSVIVILAGHEGSLSTCRFEWTLEALCFLVTVLTLVKIAAENYTRLCLPPERFQYKNQIGLYRHYTPSKFTKHPLPLTGMKALWNRDLHPQQEGVNNIIGKWEDSM
ncbi:hypothetical protein WN55_05452 [Dufourea novaeangliae]|uniref:G-protein coupled receptors family 1 profile domain-containing protein n=1 Tax=Dufourea novaeangliae TaxID=178035 RepID=A0A154P0S5_DUFNO|nr:hypothetical protein WN55_05452 [Dufourea novaeangliae]